MTLTGAEIDARRHEARKREIVERTLPVVEQLLEETDSYLHLKVEQILQLAGMSRTTFYRYFKDKNDLLVALSEPVLQEVMRAALGLGQPGLHATCKDFEAGIREGMDRYRRHITLMNAMVEVSMYDTAVHDLYQAFFGQVRQRIADQLELGQTEGFIRPGVNPHATAGWLTWMAERGMNQLVAAAEPSEREELVAGFASLVWNGTRAPESSERNLSVRAHSGAQPHPR